MDNIENQKPKAPFLTRLFRYFNSLLVIDKSVDLILIFVGLVAALGFESLQESKEIESRYIDMVARIHDEITINKYLLEDTNRSTAGYFDITREINQLVATASYEKYDGVNKMIVLENTPFQIKVYQSIIADEFLNKTLYSEVLHLYDLLTRYSSEKDDTKINLTEYYYTYYRMFVKNQFQNNYLIEEYIDINYLYNLVTKSIPILQNTSLDIEMTIERLLKSLENELDRYNTKLIEKRGLSDYLNLSQAALSAGKYNETISYSDQGLKFINFSVNDSLSDDYLDNKTYIGRFNAQLYKSKIYLYIDGDSLYPKNEIKKHLDLFYDSGYSNESSQLFYLDYYYFVDKDFNEFLISLKKYIEKYPDCNQLEPRIQSYPDFLSKPELIEFLDGALREDQVWRDWVKSYIIL